MSWFSTGKLLLATLLLVAIAVSVSLVGVEVPGLAAQVTGLAAERAAIRLESDSFRFDLRNGLVARDVEASAEIHGDVLVARAPRMTLACRLGPLLRGELVVREILLESPVIEILSRSPGAESSSGISAPGETSPGRVRFDLDRVRLRGGRVVSRMTDGSAGTSEVRGLDLELVEPRLGGSSEAGLAGLSASGRLAARELAIDRYRLPDVAAPLEVERGRFRLREFESWSAAARVTVESLEIDLAQFPYRYRVDLRASRVDLGDLLEGGEGAGPLEVELVGSGEGPGLPGAVAEMSVMLAPGSLPPLAMLERIDGTLGTELVGAAYEASRAEVSLSGVDLTVEPFEIVTSRARLVVGGTVALGGDASLELMVLVPDELGVAGLSDPVAEVLTDRSGWVQLPIGVAGPLERPRLVPGGAALDRLLERRGATAGTAIAVRSELRRLLASR